jgi:hypothetical protein
MIKEILILHHTHTDIGYTHEQPIVWELNRQFIEDALDEIDRTAGWDQPSQPIWTCEVTSTLRHWLRTATGDQIARFKRAAAAGRMSACAMPYNFTPMAGVAQFTRALENLPGLRQALGLKFNVALNHDINGLPWTMIPLMLDAGIEMVMMGINVHFGAFPLHRPMFFKWKGPDGRSIIALNGEHYGMFQRYARLDESSLDAMREGIDGYLAKLAKQNYPHDFAYLSLTHYSFWDNNPPYPAAFELIRRWNAEGRAPHIRFVTPDELLEKAQTLDLQEYAGDWTDYWNFGTGSSALETRLAHGARSNLYAADVLALQANPPRDARAGALAEKAYEALTLWDEHTWGSYASISQPDRDDVMTGWMHKAYPAYEARSLSSYVLVEQMEALAGNPRHAPATEGVLIVNPSPFPRRDVITLPKLLLDGKYDHLSSTSQRNSEVRDVIANDQFPQEIVMLGPIEVPAHGFVKAPFSSLQPAQAAGLAAGDGYIESATHRIEFNAHAGAITALIDKRTGHNLADGESEWSMLGLVHEQVDTEPAGDMRGRKAIRASGSVAQWSASDMRGREALLELDYNKFQDHSFKASWPAKRTTERVTSMTVLQQPHRIGLEVKCELPSASEVVKRIWLNGFRDAITVEIALRKSDVWTPEAIYLALPLDLPQWQATFDTMGTPTTLDVEQLPGCSRDWVTVSGYIDVHNAGAGVTLACPDMPLVMVGGFNFGQRQLTIDRNGKPLLLAWLLNNYWSTNFRVSQPGYLRFRYEVSTHRGFDPIDAARAASFARGALIIHPAVHAQDTAQGQLVEVKGEGVLLAACRSTEDGTLLWLQNVTDQLCEATIALPQRAIKAASRCNSLDEAEQSLAVNNGAIKIPVPARGIAGVVIGH